MRRGLLLPLVLLTLGLPAAPAHGGFVSPFRRPTDGCRGMIAFDADTGEERWHRKRSEACTATP